MYNELSQKKVSEVDNDINKYWKEINLLDKSIKTRENSKSFVFYEGPPTANGRPGIHHILSRSLKDAVCRYKTMCGYKVNRKGGWDTHGLPVEIEVEKELNLKSKQAIEDYGIAEFNKKCKESVFKYEAMWRQMSEEMGYLLDMDNPYITLDNKFIETEWYILKEFFKAGLIYEGYKILPFCSRCGTGLASHEVAQGYKEIKSNTVYVKFKLKDEDAYFLAWTTTPWTLAANVALTVNPNEFYVKVKHDNEYYYIEQHLADKLFEEGKYEIVQKYQGKDLEYKEYEQLMPFITPNKKAFFVTLADYVTVEDGTGIVHSAPAFGEDDYQIGRKYNLPVIQPVGEDGCYTDTIWKGRHVLLDNNLDIDIMKWLAENNKLFKKQAVFHNYPHCWRCDTPLIYYAKPSWYIEMTKLKDDLVKNNNTVNWYPDYVGEKRFGNWLENVNDWAISRSRYWGTPFPIWRCSDKNCDGIDAIGSIKELVERANEDIDESIELHRPYVDDITINCPKCNLKMNRVSDVIDCWFDSGAMPYAQWHYPFENADKFDELFPADFICEGIDQTRGWFYSLIAISTFFKKRAPYKNVLVNDLLLDKDGHKMSKHKGNTVDPFLLLEQYGADAVRWYIYYNSPAWQPTKFNQKDIEKVGLKFFSTLKNVYYFFVMYSNIDNLDVASFKVDYEERAEIDKWLISKKNKLIKEVSEDLDVYDMTKAVRRIHEFVLEDFANWYIRRNRRRFWSNELNNDKKSVYLTTYEVLVDICKITAPFAPFGVEEMYRNLTNEISVHLSYYPKPEIDKIDLNIEKRMDLVRTLVTLGRASREESKLKVRQPLQKAIINGEDKDLIYDLVDLLKEELNLKEVIFETELSEYMNFELKPNFVVVGKILGKKMNLFAKELSKLNPNEVMNKLKNNLNIDFELDGEKFSFNKEHINVNIKAKEGFAVQMQDNSFIILDTNLNDDLIAEGYAREFTSKVQQIRKNLDLNVVDKINIYYSSSKKEIEDAIKNHLEYIKVETLAKKVDKVFDDTFEKYDINDEFVGIKIEKC